MNPLLQDVTLRQLEVLVAVADNDTWSDAAAVLDTTQSAVSQSMARLASILGVDLFEKRGSRRSLTKSGERVLAYARSTRTLTNELWHEVNCGSLSHGLRLGMIDAAALYLMQESLEEYRTEHPAVEVFVSVDSSERLLEALRAGDLDLAFVVGAGDEEQVAVIATEELRVYGDTSLSGAVMYEKGSRTRDLVDRGLAELGIVADVQATASNPAVLAELAKLGVGWTVIPTGVAEQSGALDPLGRVVASRELVALRRPSDTDALTSDFLAYVQTRAEGR